MSCVKIAFFVEGYTERVFLKKLLLEIFTQNQIVIEIRNITGGNKVAIKYSIIESSKINDNTKYFVLIYDCNGDSSIKSYILENRGSLIKAGYKKVIGLRDVYPDVKRNEVDKLEKGLLYNLPQKDLPIKFVLSTMEIEGWFLADDKHYINIDEKLDDKHIADSFGFEPSIFNTELFDEPANKLITIYKSVGKTYKKEKYYIDRTIEALDYSNIYFSVKERIKSLKELIFEFEDVLY